MATAADLVLYQQGVQSLMTALEAHRPDADLARIDRAARLARFAHRRQRRKSGQPYVVHPIAVATIVAELRLDDDAVIAALLHDVLEDTQTPRAWIEAWFGHEVVTMIEGVTKLSLNVQAEANEKQRAVAETHRAAESLRKLLMAMAQDFRVMVIKLADRLHNMRTLGAMPEKKQTRIANETLDVYAPIAARLGVYHVKSELEDLSFAVLHPQEFAEIRDRVAKTNREREGELSEAMVTLREKMAERGLRNFTVNGRSKHLYSIFNKVVKHGVPFEEIFDLVALRIIVQEPHECYTAMGVVYEMYRPIPNLFTDYIQTPKPNGYQSLHMKVMGPGNAPLEVQIRTKHMHEVAEFGLAAHWSYKEGAQANNSEARLGQLRRQLFEWSSDNSQTSDFLRNVSTDLFKEQVFAFTPKGDIIDLPAGSTCIDFAFRVHTNVGTRMVGAKINGIGVKISTEIKNGDVVELITRNNAQPSLDWLEHAHSQHTRNKIRGFFRKRNRSENEARGRDALEKGFKAVNIDPRQGLSDDVMTEVAKQIRDAVTPADVMARVGEGLTSVQSVVDRVLALIRERRPPEAPAAPVPAPAPKKPEATLVRGVLDNVMLKRARCCMPVPGDEVIGYVTRGRGIMIHRRLCPNALRMQGEEAERLTPIEWLADEHTHPVDLMIITINRHGLLMDITTILAESKAGVSHVNIRTLPNHTAEIAVTLEVRDAKHLREVMTKIGNYSDVISILRATGSPSGSGPNRKRK